MRRVLQILLLTKVVLCGQDRVVYLILLSLWENLALEAFNDFGKDSLTSFKPDGNTLAVRNSSVLCKVKSRFTSGAALWHNNCSR